MNATDMTPPRGALAKIEHLLVVEQAKGEHITLGALSDAMEERAFGLLLLVLALPCCLPFVYLLPQLVALPMVVLAWQMASGRNAPWLPETLRKRSMSIQSLLDVVRRATQYGGWLEKLAHPRLLPMTSDTGVRIVGALLIVPCLSVLVPLPLTNTVPGFGVVLAAIGLIERDGIFTALGVATGLLWVALLAIGGPTLIYFLVDFFLNR